MMKYSLFRRHSLIRQMPAFSKLSWFDLQRIAFHASFIEYKKGDIIRTQGDPADALYCLLSGRIQAYILDGGRKTHVEFFRRGNYFGIVSLLTGESHSMTFEALNDSVILRIEKNNFHKMVHAIPQLGLEFSHMLSHRIRRRLTQREQTVESMIVSIYSPRRGAGCSTFALNFALSLAKESRKQVIVVNFDSTLSPGGILPEEEKTVNPQWKKRGVSIDVLENAPEDVAKYISPLGPQADVLNVSFDPQDPSLVNLISHFVTTLTLDYRFIVVDLPTEMDSIVLKTLGQSDLIALFANAADDEDCRFARQVIYKLEEELKENFKPENVLLLVSEKPRPAVFSREEINRKIDFEVFSQLPPISNEDLTQRLDTPEVRMDLPKDDGAYMKAVTRISRRVSGVQIGLVLGGGAALGIAHIGVLKVLEREKIPIDMVVGSSMGALLASLWVTGQDSAGIKKLASEFRNRRAILKLIDPVLPVSGVIGGRMIVSWLRSRHLGDKTFYDARIPLRIVAYDLVKRRELVINSGNLVAAVRKSIAIPGIIEPVIEGDQVIIDGGVLNPLPTNILKDAGINRIIAVNVLQSPADINNGYSATRDRIQKEKDVPFRSAPWQFIKTRFQLGAMKAFNPNISDIIVRSLLASEYVIAERSSEIADVVIHPELSDVNWYELHKVDQLIERGEKAAEAALPQIKKLCGL